MTISKEDMEELKHQTVEVLGINPGTLLYGLDSAAQVVDALEQVAWMTYSPNVILEALDGTLAPANRDLLRAKVIRALKARELLPQWETLHAQTRKTVLASSTT